MAEVTVTPCTHGPRVRLTVSPATRQMRFGITPAPRLQFSLRRGGNCSAALVGDFVHFTFNGHTVRVPRDDV